MNEETNINEKNINSEKKRFILFICCGILLLTAIGSFLLVRERSKPSENLVTESYYAAEETFPPTPSPSISAPFTSSPSQTKEKIDLNKASKEELKTLPGIGDALAERIVAYRSEKPFHTIYDLKKVSGIGDKKFEKIKENIMISE